MGKTYVVSDLHGCSADFFDFLEDVDFSDEDTLYILGDILNRGPNGISLILEIMDMVEKGNVMCLLGNHEHMIVEMLEQLSVISDRNEQLEIIRENLKIEKYQQDQTLYDFIELSPKDQNRILNFIHNLPLYLEITVNEQNYILIHGGISDDNEELPMEYYGEELASGPHAFWIRHFEDAIVIVGHLPTRFIEGAEPDEIFRSNQNIGIDCGLGFTGGRLGVLVLETDEELYY